VVADDAGGNEDGRIVGAARRAIVIPFRDFETLLSFGESRPQVRISSFGRTNKMPAAS